MKISRFPTFPRCRKAVSSSSLSFVKGSLSSLAAFLGLAALGAGGLDAATTDPVGAMSMNIAAGSDGFISAAFNRTPVYSGAVASIVDPSTFTTSPGSSWTVNEFADSYYVLMTSGVMEGAFATISGNGSDSISLTYVAESFSLGQGGGVSVNDTFDIIPYWTLSSLLPEAEVPNGTQVLLFDRSAPGINNAAASTYTMFAGFGWFSGPTDGNNLILYPDESFILRAPVGAAISLTQLGSVRTSAFRLLLSLNNPATKQDIRLTSTSPVPEAISSIFDAGLAADGDQILIFDPNATGINNAAAMTATYFNGFGWFSGSTNLNNYLLQPGQGFIYRKSNSNPNELVSVAPSPIP